MSEAQLQAACYKWFRQTYPTEADFMWMNYNNPKSPSHGAVLIAMGLHSGVADMTYLAAGNFPYFFELKIDRGAQTKTQKAWERAIIARGGIYTIIRTLEQFKAWVHIAQCHPGHKPGAQIVAFAEEHRVDYRQLEILHHHLWCGQQNDIPAKTMEYFMQLNLQTA